MSKFSQELDEVKGLRHTAAGVLRLLAVLALGFGVAAFFVAGVFFGSTALGFSFLGAPRFLGAAVLVAASFFRQIISEELRDHNVKSYLRSSCFLLLLRRRFWSTLFLC